MKQEDYIKECKHHIDDVLQAFKVGHEGITAKAGPTVTLFEFRPNIGTRFSKVTNLKNEFAGALGVQSVRVVAPTANGSIGIEVPNPHRFIIQMYDMLYSDEYMNTDMALPLCLGRKVDCSIFMADLAEMPHLLIAGATGMGKSVGLNVIISSLINKRTPNELKLILIDPKQVELAVYEPISRPYLAKKHRGGESIITDAETASETLKTVCELMDSRYSQLKKFNVRNIKEYNKVCKDSPMCYYVIIIDEYGDLIMQANGRELENSICRLAQKARAVGIHLIISTQRPSTDVVTGRIKANFPTRIAFRTTTGTDSRVILGHIGAEKLTGKGDMIYSNGGEDIRVQFAYLSTEEVNDLCQEMSEEYPDYETVILDDVVPRPENKIVIDQETIDNAERFIKECRIRIDKSDIRTNSFFIGTERKIINNLIALGVIGEEESMQVGWATIRAHPLLIKSQTDLHERLAQFMG